MAATETLIIDDDEITILILDTIINHIGVKEKPVKFTNAEVALHYVNQNNNSENTFLILLDINLPNFNGWDFLDAINSKKYSCEIFVIIVTSSVDSYDKEIACKYPQIIDFFEKPVDINNLIQLQNNENLREIFN